VLSAAVQAGAGREQAHEAIKEHAVAVALEMREEAVEANDLFDRLAADDRIPLDRAALDALVADPGSFAGAATRQVRGFVEAVGTIVARSPEAAAYTPAPIL
jgi:adenylosuccinate lyase